MNILRLFILIYYFIRYNCFFCLALIPHGVFYPFKLIYNPNSLSQAIRLKKFLSTTPLLIKLGQILATRIDIFNPVFIAQLSNLNDQTQNSTLAYLEKIFYHDFQQNVHSIFSNISLHSIASASIAKVYSAQLNNKPVAIKVIDPKLKNIIKNDIKILKLIFTILEVFNARAKISKPTKIVTYLEHQLKFELDLRLEAACADQLRENFAKDDDIHIPQIYWNWTSQHILAEEWIDGIKIDDMGSIEKHKLDKKSIVQKLSKLFFFQTLRDGFFHGDIHSGNTKVLTNGKICFLDFGIMGNLNHQLKFHVKEVFIAFLNRDYTKASQIHFDAGWVDSSYNVDEFAIACRSIMEKVLNVPQNQIAISKLLEQLFLVSGMFNMEIQQDLLLLQKNLVYLENTARKLCPNDNMWLMSKDIIKNNIKTDLLMPNYYQYKATNLLNRLKNNIIKEIRHNTKAKSYPVLIFILNYCIIFTLLYILYKRL